MDDTRLGRWESRGSAVKLPGWLEWIAFAAGHLRRDGRQVRCGEPEQGFQCNIPVDAARVAKDKFLELNGDRIAAAAAIAAEAAPLHRRESSTIPAKTNPR